MATITQLLTKSSDIGMEGCIGNLYNTSIEKMRKDILQPKHRNKHFLLNPKSLLEFPLLLSEVVESIKLFTCLSNDHHHSVSDNPYAVCPYCKQFMDKHRIYCSKKCWRKRRRCRRIIGWFRDKWFFFFFNYRWS